MPVTIRPATAADQARCEEIAVAAWRPIYASSRQLLGDAIFDHLYRDWPARKAGQIAAAFERHPEWILVACAGQELAGFATFRLDPQRLVGEIGNNAVDPAWQGRGVAGHLYDETIAIFRRHGLRVAKVSTGLDDAHAPARAAYRKAGFSAAVPSVTLYREI